jgi:hypothetical protein
MNQSDHQAVATRQRRKIGLSATRTFDEFSPSQEFSSE